MKYLLFIVFFFASRMELYSYYTLRILQARVYAEDPCRDFLPSTGNVLQYVEPPIGASHNRKQIIRVDSGIVEGCAISPYFDPMISKLVAYSPHGRQCALDALETAVDQYVIRGVNHNLPFISELLRHPDFKEGKTPTNFIPKHYPSGFHGVKLTQNELYEFAAAAASIYAQWESINTSDELIICLDGIFGQFYSVSYEISDINRIHVRPLSNDGTCEDVSAARSIQINRINLDSSSHLATIVCDDQTKTLQVREKEFDVIN
jgi:acetyl/propionyl-CoA carboxylase alpha subunit